MNASTVSGSLDIWGHSSSKGTCDAHKGSVACRLMSKSVDVEFQTEKNEAASPMQPSASISTSRNSTSLNLRRILSQCVAHAQGSSGRGRYRTSLTAEKNVINI